MTRAARPRRGSPIRISVIIPTLDEEAHLPAALECVRRAPGVEMIVVDGGSHDRTSAIARSLGATVLSAARGRGCQMNAGARAACGDVLLFLHADTRLPADFPEHVRQTLDRPGVVAGAFRLRIATSNPALRLVERLVRWRNRWLRLPYGDQALFMSAAAFAEVGGFPELPIMEDFELVRRLKRLGRIAFASASVVTSPRRWLAGGVVRVTVTNQAVIAGHLLRIPSSRLARWRERLSRPSHRRQVERPAPLELELPPAPQP